MAKPSAVTSFDVAKRAGVSRQTVSTVLNGARGTARVSEETRQRIVAAATALGYSPHPVAQALSRRRSGIVAFVPFSARNTPFAHPVPYLLSMHMGHVAAEHGYHLIEATAETPAARSRDELVEFLLNRRVDGVIFTSPETASEVRRVRDRGLPVVQIMRPQFAVPTPTVTVDATAGVHAAVDHLVAQGHRRIAYMGRGGAHPLDRDRRASFTAALAAHGLTLRDDDVHLVAAYALEAGDAATRALLARPDLPTALFVAADNVANGALRALYAARVRVPEAMSVISYDDAYAAYLYPPLTSVAQPFAAVAARAFALMVAQIEQPDTQPDAPEQVVLPTSLVVRESTAAPARDVLGER